MKETGWVKVSQTDVMQLHYQYREEKNRPLETDYVRDRMRALEQKNNS